MSAIDVNRRFDLHELVNDLRLAARTIRSETLVERHERRDSLAEEVRARLEAHANADEAGLEALNVWTDALEHADVADIDVLQELLYGIDALVRVHLWRETGLPLEPPERRTKADI